jgi:hypothetical protein
MTDDRIAALERQINAAQAELQSIKAERPAAPSLPPRGEVRIVPILSEPPSLPSLKETERLFAAVKALSPWPEALNDKYDPDRPSRGFSVAFRWVQSVPRSDRPNGKVALSFWMDCCKNWLRDRGSMTGDLSANSLLLAVFAAGDVCYCPANAQLGVTWEIGLLEYGGKPANADAWRRVMKEGAAAVLPPSSPARRLPMAPAVRIYGG